MGSWVGRMIPCVGLPYAPVHAFTRSRRRIILMNEFLYELEKH